MTRTCAELFENTPCTILGNKNELVSGLSYRSDRVQPGDAFFCIVGQNVDGHTFAQDAIDRGASILVVERKVYLADATDVTEVVVSDSRRAMADAACAFYDEPSKSFNLVGITGTNGKTTTTYLVDHIAKEMGKRTGVIGTVGLSICGKHEKSEHTTPESPDLQSILARMRDAGCEVVSMEVSSHALDLERVWGTDFAVTAFSNLTQDHLDYHQTFEAYFEAKAILFSKGYPAKRVINTNDKWGAELLNRCKAMGDDVISVGSSSDCDIWPESAGYSSAETHVVLNVLGERLSFSYPLVGRFNVENVMLAFGIALQLGFDSRSIALALETASPVPGRLERVRVDDDGGISVFVDYAHTPDALEKAIASVRHLAGSNRTLVVFGCGGDRDSTKRPIMGRAALAADFAIVTSDNPRSEEPASIIEDIVAGMGEGGSRYIVESDRKTAIAKAIDMANPGDCILIAGKGHEDYQIIGSTTIHFDDREAAADALNAKASATKAVS